MDKVLDCSLEVSEFKLHLRYYVHFRTNTFDKGMKPFMGLNSTTTILLQV